MESDAPKTDTTQAAPPEDTPRRAYVVTSIPSPELQEYLGALESLNYIFMGVVFGLMIALVFALRFRD